MLSEFYIIVLNIFCFILLRCTQCPTLGQLGKIELLDGINYLSWWKKIEMVTTVGEIDYSL
jgi:hypothetical protein